MDTLFKKLLTEDLLTKTETIFLHSKDNQSLRDMLMLKLAEECSELSAELIQKFLHPTHETDEKIENEIGDVLTRLLLVVDLYNHENILNRVNFKMSKLHYKLFKTA
jgi:NTP pyrophosphatase (non-canonical NTP hydrolase)